MRWNAVLLAVCLSMPLSAQSGSEATGELSIEQLVEAVGLPAVATDFSPVDPALGADPLLAGKIQGEAPDAQREAAFAQSMACARRGDFACALRLWHDLGKQLPANWQPEAYALALWQLDRREAAIAWYDRAAVTRGWHGIASRVEPRLHRMPFARDALRELFTAWSAQRAPLRKTVMVDVEIDRGGKPTRVRVLDDALDARLRAQIQNAVAGWQFAPAKFAEQPVDTLAATAYVEVRGRPISDEQVRFEIAYAGFGARPVHTPSPHYPRNALLHYREGSVLLRADYDTDGEVLHVRIVEPSGSPQLDNAAVAAVRRWRFEPMRINGEPRAHYALVPIVFEIDAGRQRFDSAYRARASRLQPQTR